MSAHTPGPWAVYAYLPHGSADSEWRIEETRGGSTVAIVVTDREDAEMDATLIAAAPEMLNALREAYGLMPLDGTKKRAAWVTAASTLLADIEGKVHA